MPPPRARFSSHLVLVAHSRKDPDRKARPSVPLPLAVGGSGLAPLAAWRDPVNFTLLFAALAALAMGHTTILEEFCLQAHPFVGCNLPLGNTTANQSANPNASVTGPDDMSVEASGLAG